MDFQKALLRGTYERSLAGEPMAGGRKTEGAELQIWLIKHSLREPGQTISLYKNITPVQIFTDLRGCLNP